MNKQEFARIWINIVTVILTVGLIGVFVYLAEEQPRAQKLFVIHIFIYVEIALLFSYVIVRPLLYYLLNRGSHD